MFDGLGRSGLGQTLAENAGTDPKLDRQLVALVGDGCRTRLYAITGACSRIHVGPLQDNERIAVAIDPGQQLCEFFVLALELGAKAIDLSHLALDGVFTAVEGFLHLHAAILSRFAQTRAVDA